MTAMEQVTALMGRWEAAWNAGDAAAMATLFADDVHWVNVVGMHWRGKRAVQHAHQVYLDTMFKGVAHRMEAVESVAELPGGALVAVVLWWMDSFRQPDGATRPAGQNRMTAVLEPAGDGYLIRHGANVTILPQAQPFDPAKQLEAA